MFKSFYSLSKRPFDKEIRGKDMFLSISHQEIQARLNYLKDNRGIGLVTGDAGSGKTSSLRAFAASLNPSLYRVVYFPLSTVTVQDFYRGLAFSLGLEAAFRKVDLFHQIQEAIQSLYAEKKTTPVIILDELQLASTHFLSDLHLLFNFSMDSENPFILVLCGLPALATKLSLTHQQPLAQRLIMRYKAPPLTPEETRAYLEHHMSLAGAKHPIFNDNAVGAITTVSRGLPRLVNNLATNALIYGYQKKLELIDEEAIRQAAIELGM
jgi:type II secretory pathway predicted ATPase ExeA